MKIIQDREAIRIGEMISSRDVEMRELAVKILMKRQIVRFSFGTIMIFHLLLIPLSTSVIIWVSNHYQIGYYWIPLVMFLLIQILCTVIYLTGISNFRSEYNTWLKKNM